MGEVRRCPLALAHRLDAAGHDGVQALEVELVVAVGVGVFFVLNGFVLTWSMRLDDPVSS